jgi:hypothetical protein
MGKKLLMLGCTARLGALQSASDQQHYRREVLYYDGLTAFVFNNIPALCG